jgi:hypothetical protein
LRFFLRSPFLVVVLGVFLAVGFLGIVVVAKEPEFSY